MIDQIFDFTWGWIIGGLVIAGLEILIPGAFLIWIGLGAFAVGLVLTLAPGLGLAWQMLIFAVAMVSSLALGFLVQRRSGTTRQATMLNREMEAMIGQSYLAITSFDTGRGRIRVRDSSYSAIGDDSILEGDMVRVVAIVDGRPKVEKSPT